MVTDTQEGIHLFDHALQTAHLWIKEIMRELHQEDPHDAYKAMRVVLHTLRDRLPAEEATQLGSQLPRFISAVYYEGFKIRTKPLKYHRDEFFQEIAKRLKDENVQNPDPMRFAYAVIRLLMRHVSKGELDNIDANLPSDMKAVWEMFENQYLPRNRRVGQK
jgi:uncharacterized protein (DUF2267 family)